MTTNSTGKIEINATLLWSIMGTMSLMLISLGAYHVNYRLSCHTQVLEQQGSRIEENMLNIKTNQEAIKHLLETVFRYHPPPLSSPTSYFLNLDNNHNKPRPPKTTIAPQTAAGMATISNPPRTFSTTSIITPFIIFRCHHRSPMRQTDTAG